MMHVCFRVHSIRFLIERGAISRFIQAKQAPGNKFFIVPRYPSGVTNQRFRWLVIYYPYTRLRFIVVFSRDRDFRISITADGAHTAAARTSV